MIPIPIHAGSPAPLPQCYVMFYICRFVLLIFAFLLLSCSDLREEGDINGIYCRKFKITNIGNMDYAFISADTIAKGLAKSTDRSAEYESDLSMHSIRFSILVPIRDHIFNMKVDITGINSDVIIAFGFDRFILDNKKAETVATEDEMKTAIKVQDNIFGRFKTAMRMKRN